MRGSRTHAPTPPKRSHTRKPSIASIAARNTELRAMLTSRRDELRVEVDNGIRLGRDGRPKEGGDNLEDSDAATQGDITLSLLQMRAEMLTRIEQALVRLDGGRYGTCFECEQDIPEARLRALPFAVRCQECEGVRELVQGRAKRQEQQRGSFWLLADKPGI